ncbi:RodZ family helix-turn-helix domain-containing protein [Halobacillus sp. Marseille-Q1614]|uniref:helix-turn-helix domain-containing protein n=1 Tax=Halobacillus sp. Marseille-Q1614 TaxID=2709134 RepID=UPI0015713219|nr:helix-turn-helix domain-containing protein [Halobacillus sp. Marseille-Q1614]
MEIGERLKEAREAKKLSLEEVQQKTKIQKRYLQAIEKNEFGILPGKFYTRAFIREYASAVGLDPEKVMEEHKSELPSTEEEQVITHSRVQRAKTEGSVGKPGGGSLSKAFPTLITIVLIIGALFVAWFFIMQITEPDSGTTDSQSEDQVNVTSSDTGEGASDEEGSGSGESEKNRGDAAEEEDEQESQEEEAEEPQLEISLAETGTGGFPEHVYEVTGTVERELKIEFEGDTYLEVQAPKGGENLVDPITYTSEDDTITQDISDYKEVYVRTGSVPGLKVYINDEEIEFPADNLTQKLLIKFEE